MNLPIVSQQPGCVVDPSYVIYASVFGINERNEICLIGVEEPEKKSQFRKKLMELYQLSLNLLVFMNLVY